MVEVHATKRFFKGKQPYLMIITLSVQYLPVIAQLVERRTVVGQSPDILRSAVRLRLAGKNFFDYPERQRTGQHLFDLALICFLNRSIKT